MRNRNLVASKTIFQCSMRCCLLLFFLPIVLLTITNRRAVVSARAIRAHETTPTLESDPQNVHAIIVSSSRYWFNYRHAINALGMYEIYRQNGIPDENIILSKCFLGAYNMVTRTVLIPRIYQKYFLYYCTSFRFSHAHITNLLFFPKQ